MLRRGLGRAIAVAAAAAVLTVGAAVPTIALAEGDVAAVDEGTSRFDDDLPSPVNADGSLKAHTMSADGATITFKDSELGTWYRIRFEPPAGSEFVFNTTGENPDVITYDDLDASEQKATVGQAIWVRRRGRNEYNVVAVIYGLSSETEFEVDVDSGYEGSATINCEYKSKGEAGARIELQVSGVTGPASVRIPDAEGKTHPQACTMMRLYNPYTGEHLYTSSYDEMWSLSSIGWHYEGVSWTAPTSGTEVYRLYNPYVEGGDHFYTANQAEVEMLKAAGWSYEGVAWHTASDKGVAVYRAYNPNAATGTHQYTTSFSEIESITQSGWRKEGTAWYGII
jgi:hypothetical protein